MKRFSVLMAAMCLLPVALAAGCDSPSEGGGPIIIISDTWENVQNPENTFFFRSPDDGQRSGVVAGTETRPGGGAARPLGGFWAGGRLEFTVHRAEDDRPKFVAYFQGDDPNELELTQVGSSQTIRIRKR
jgi:hypothetical protein